ncbi:hypothetical protein [Streptomyces hokutonensis]|uniref:hypothetical protein n=1 Tax=Streptomyces hokutonensis TaxID=1306990 RepID=UPI00036AB913|nr:hypothetical protein [Streptomyces hokutonensis]
MDSRTPPGPPEGPLHSQGHRDISRLPRSWRRFLTHAGAAVIGLFIGVLIGLTGNPNADKASPSATVTATTTALQTVRATGSPAVDKVPADGIPGDGTYVVGSDIKPGTYSTKGPQGGLITSCYWARLSSTSGEVKDIIANNATSGRTTVTISASDKAFTTTGCKPWKKTG